MEKNNKILTVINVNKFFKKRNTLKHALKDINFEVEEGDFFGIIGESGSGKTTLGKAIVRLHPISGGNIYFYNKLISNKKMKRVDHQYVCDNVQMVFQDPMSSLNPKMNILKIVSEPLVINKEIHKKVNDIMDKKYRLNTIFEYDILNKLTEASLSKILNFYQQYENEISNQIEDLKTFEYSNTNDWISSFNEVDEKYTQFINKMKLHINQLSLMIDDEDKIIEKSFDIDPNQQEIYNYVNGTTDLENQYIKAQNKFNEIKSLLNSLKAAIREKKEKNILKIRYDEFIIQKKFHFDNAKTRPDKISYYNEMIQCRRCKAYIYAIKKIFQYESLSELEVKEDMENIFSKIDNYFKNINDRLFEIKTNEEFIVESSKIDEQISQEEIIAFIDPLFDAVKDKFSFKNKENKIIDEEMLDKISQDFKIAKRKLNDSKSKKPIKTNNKKSFQSAHSSYKERYISSKEKIYNPILESIKTSKKNVRVKMKKLIKVFDEKTKVLYLMRPDALKEFSKKEQKSIISKNKKSFKTQISTKKKTFKSIDWEAKNIIDIDFVNRKLCSSSKAKLWFYKGELTKLLILDSVFKLLESVGLKKEHAYRYPHEFSGGQRQRIVIARSLITNPKLIVADEAISALDVSVQAQVINIMKDLSERQGMTFLFIAHDLSMVRHICNKVIIMHNGAIVEKGLVSKVFENPIHPYTKSLFMAVPELNKMDIDLAAFDDNSEYAKDYSISNVPKFYEVSAGHEVLATESQFKEWVKWNKVITSEETILM